MSFIPQPDPASNLAHNQGTADSDKHRRIGVVVAVKSGGTRGIQIPDHLRIGERIGSNLDNPVCFASGRDNKNALSQR